jgi:hypothetical protein
MYIVCYSDGYRDSLQAHDGTVTPPKQILVCQTQLFFEIGKVTKCFGVRLSPLSGCVEKLMYKIFRTVILKYSIRDMNVTLINIMSDVVEYFHKY